MNTLAVRAAVMAVWLAVLLGWVPFVMLGVVRIGYPLELGNIEGLMMDHITRLAHGQPIYVAPSLEFIPLAYMPLYPALVSLVSRVFGTDLWIGRLVSWLAAIAVACLIAWIVRRESRDFTLGAAAGGLFLMGQGFARGNYDLVRPDSLMLLLAFSGLALLRFTSSTRGAVLAALFMVAAFFTKQHALCLGIAATLYMATQDRNRSLAFGGTLLVGCIGGFLLLSRWLGPWFAFYVFEVPAHWSQLSHPRVLDYLGHVLGIFGLISGPALLALALPAPPWRGPVGLWWWVGFGAIATGLLSTLDPYAYRQVYMPTIAGFAVLGPIALQRLAEALAPAPGRPGSSNVMPRASMSAAAAIVMGFQFVPMHYPVSSLVPPAGAAEARFEFERALRGMPGPVMVPFHGYFADLAGKGIGLNVLTLEDVIRAHGNRLLEDDPQHFTRTFEALRRGPGRPTLVTDFPLAQCGDASAELWASLEPGYRLAGRLDSTLTMALQPVSGNRYSPTYVYVPVDSAESARNP